MMNIVRGSLIVPLTLLLGCGGSTPATNAVSDPASGSMHDAHPLTWRGDVLEFAPAHTFDAREQCITMPFEGEPIEICDDGDASYDECENRSCVPSTEVVTSPTGLLAWRPTHPEVKRYEFCVLEEEDHGDGDIDGTRRCYKRPNLELTEQQAADPVLHAMTGVRSVFLQYSGVPLFKPDAQCFEWQASLSRTRTTALLTRSFTHRGKPYSVEHDIGLGKAVGESYSWGATSGYEDATPRMRLGCFSDFGKLVEVTDDAIAFETITWYRSRAACERATREQMLARITPCGGKRPPG